MTPPKSDRPSKRCRVCKRRFYKRPGSGVSRWEGQETCGNRSCVSLSGHRNRGTYRKLVKHRCRLEGCGELVEPREGEWPSDYRSRGYHSDACAHAGRAKVRRERRVVAERSRVVLRVCELDGCEELIPCGEGVTPSDYARIRYHAAGCRDAGRAAKVRALHPPPVERDCECGCGPFLPARKTRRFASASCAMRARNRGRVRETKVCECGCATVFERPRGIAGAEWGRRRFVDAEHRRRAEQRPGEARAGKRREPRCAPSKDRKPKDQPEPPRPVFAGPSPVAPWRPPVPEVVRVERTKPRPSFGLTRRSA